MSDKVFPIQVRDLATARKLQADGYVVEYVGDAVPVEVEVNAPSTTTTEVETPTEWINVAGVTCKGQFPTWTSSLAIVRHLRNTCGCETNPEDCKAASKFGYGPDTLGSDPEAIVPANLLVKEGQAQF